MFQHIDAVSRRGSLGEKISVPQEPLVCQTLVVASPQPPHRAACRSLAPHITADLLQHSVTGHAEVLTHINPALADTPLP